MRSRIGVGSVFAITVPFGRASFPDIAAPVANEPRFADSLAGLRVLCIDNDREILEGMRALLSRWKAVTLVAATTDEAIALLDVLGPGAAPDVALVDYHLHDRLDGLGIIDLLRERLGPDFPAALLTGDGSDALKHAARAHRCRVLTKPVKPASLRAFLAAQR